ncbi:class I SAM-dependent methyltransferase [Anaerotignum sp.]|uniref:class I SAM-dependent methyltransferase n=1 Tax=Anaerotignum sp. TaxID=2039241 RepID=UPI0028AD1C48|nr:class I SAM-dependent methyltransferase [Anaerotignum sp.]
MFKSISKMLERPPLFTPTETAFWDDDYISKQMLKAHLDPEFEGASRKLTFIEESVSWIKDVVSPVKYPLLLDVGCGPGIYAERFAKIGYQVTGIDFSKRSINYAKSSALKNGLDIAYHYQDYLTMRLNTAFDFATMIYCDYGALSKDDRAILMRNVYHHLKPGGKFLLDVFSVPKYNILKEEQVWETCQNGGFWREEKYIAFSGLYKYPNNVSLEQISILSAKDTATYYLWTSYFTKDDLVNEAKKAGFKAYTVFGDVAGNPYREDNHTISILLEK